MTREQMLQQLGISDGDFTDFLKKLSAFRDSLNPQQLRLLNDSGVTVQEVAKAFGPSASVADVEQLFAEAPPVDGIACVYFGGPPQTDTPA